MEQVTMIGTIVIAAITLLGFVTSIIKLVQPINELRIAIQKLNDNLEHIKNENSSRDAHIKKHDDDIEDLNERMYTVEKKIAVYHSHDKKGE